VVFNEHQQRRDRASNKLRTATEALSITHDNSRKIVGNTVSTTSNEHKRDKARGMYVTRMQTAQPLKIEACNVNIQGNIKQAKQTPSYVPATLNINNLSIN
jgi:hypothetical protein